MFPPLIANLTHVTAYDADDVWLPPQSRDEHLRHPRTPLHSPGNHRHDRHGYRDFACSRTPRKWEIAFAVASSVQRALAARVREQPAVD